MKYFYLLFTFIFFKNALFCQFKIDAGEDLYLCDSFGKEILSPLSKNRGNMLLGGTPTVIQGTPPYKYKWEFIFKTNLSSLPYIHASNILDDTTIANPKINFSYLFPNRRYKIYLIVTDSLNNTSRDSVTFAISKFVYSDAIIYLTKNKNDTINLGGANIGQGMPPIKTYYIPNTYVDSVKLTSWTPFNVQYRVFIIDSLGCKSFENDWLNVSINSSSIVSTEDNIFFSNFHNPVNDYSIYNLNSFSNIKKIEILNISGHKIYSSSVDNSIFPLGKFMKNKGVYFLIIYQNDDKINRIKILKE
jgi:hypothetical protein